MANDQYPRDHGAAPAADHGHPGPGPRRRDLPYKAPALAGLLSGLLPGLGQIYVGYYQVGLILAAVFAGVITVLAGGADGLEPFFGIMVGFTWLYGIIDAVRRAQAVNLALDGFGSGPLPEDLTLPAAGGSRTGGVILMVLGLLLVLHTGFDLELRWLEDWWPLLLIGLGAWLFWRSRQEAAAGEATASGEAAAGRQAPASGRSPTSGDPQRPDAGGGSGPGPAA
jgi:hypothetical protein